MNREAYQHFLRVSNDYCETSRHNEFWRDGGERVIALNGPYQAWCFLSTLIVECTIHVLCTLG